MVLLSSQHSAAAAAAPAVKFSSCEHLGVVRCREMGHLLCLAVRTVAARVAICEKERCLSRTMYCDVAAPLVELFG